MTHNCLICNKIADRKVTTSFNQGELYLCSSEECKTKLKNDLTDNIEYDSIDFQGRSPEKYESSSKVIVWSFISMLTIVIIYGICKLLINYH